MIDESDARKTWSFNEIRAIEGLEPRIEVKREPLTYEQGNTVSFFADLARSTILGDLESKQRLDRHAIEQRTNPNNTTGTGGEFTPPLWVIGQAGPGIAAGRILPDLVDRVGNLFPLPRGVSSVNIPKITTGASAAIQPANADPVSETDEVTDKAAQNVVTITGEADVSQQLLDLTPAPGLDRIVYMDLEAAYNQQFETQLMTGTGTGGQLLGLLNVSGIIKVAAGSAIVPANLGGASNMIASFWIVLGSLLAQTANGRQQAARHILMAPRRWDALAFGLDQQGRPISVPGSDAPSQADWPETGIKHGFTAAVGPVGGCPVWQSAVLGPVSNTAGSGGAGATDTCLVIRPRDFIIYESPTPTFSIAANPLSGALQSRLTYRKYGAAILNRYPSGIGAATGMIQPTSGLTGFTY